MSFISLPTGKLYKKQEKKRLKIFSAGYMGKFYRNLANNVDTFLGSYFYGRIANNAELPSEDVQKYLPATSNFSKGIQNDISPYVIRDRINNASFRQKFDPIAKIIIRRENPVEVVFEDVSTFDAENPIVGSLLRELNVSKKDIACELIKKVPRQPELDFLIQNWLNNLEKKQRKQQWFITTTFTSTIEFFTTTTTTTTTTVAFLEQFFATFAKLVF